MTDFLEAIVLLLPPDAGGRVAPIAPRERLMGPLLDVNPNQARQPDHSSTMADKTARAPNTSPTAPAG